MTPSFPVTAVYDLVYVRADGHEMNETIEYFRLWENASTLAHIYGL